MTAKIQKINNDIEKLKNKINEFQAKLRELEKQKVELENSSIIEAVRSTNIPLSELETILKKTNISINNVDILGQIDPKLNTQNKEDKNNETDK